MEPCLELRGISQGGQVAPRGDERFLRGVFGPRRIVEDQAGHGVQAIDREAHDLAIGVLVARHRAFDEMWCHRPRPRAVPRCRHMVWAANDPRLFPNRLRLAVNAFGYTARAPGPSAPLSTRGGLSSTGRAADCGSA